MRKDFADEYIFRKINCRSPYSVYRRTPQDGPGDGPCPSCGGFYRWIDFSYIDIMGMNCPACFFSFKEIFTRNEDGEKLSIRLLPQ